ncbi:hypothetical protein GGTG_12084 [Gaeumannomyces tritici R3-111a-1]|uniref:Uncharacterized protein n=1 Tax=Gaeumannomyces tritici (strain R3-111a-1) TaxID=644352 RepID=J3PF05_GAET3|nr:hypothetical protein GGTG_12084 [Gaeumannomyces tritici R3-111a-1]EJT71063.1 hypothetical protein GGTG_12084 [Gaeumannomyces tritici R3-111a-1]
MGSKVNACFKASKAVVMLFFCFCVNKEVIEINQEAGVNKVQEYVVYYLLESGWNIIGKNLRNFFKILSNSLVLLNKSFINVNFLIKATVIGFVLQMFVKSQRSEILRDQSLRYDLHSFVLKRMFLWSRLKIPVR